MIDEKTEREGERCSTSVKVKYHIRVTLMSKFYLISLGIARIHSKMYIDKKNGCKIIEEKENARVRLITFLNIKQLRWDFRKKRYGWRTTVLLMFCCNQVKFSTYSNPHFAAILITYRQRKEKRKGLLERRIDR